MINRENTQRRIVIGANTSVRDLESLVKQWESAVKLKVKLPEGYFLRFEGEFQAQQAAAKRITFYFTLVLLAVSVCLSIATAFMSLSRTAM